MAQSKNRRKSPNPAPIDPNQHHGISLGFGQNRGRKEQRDLRRANEPVIHLGPNTNASGATQ